MAKEQTSKRRSSGQTQPRVCEYCKKPFELPFHKRNQLGRFCSKQCKYLSMRVSLEDRFLANLSEPTASGCIEWLGTKNDHLGYGRIQVGNGSRKMVYAHRVAWERINGPVPDGLFVCHKCDNPRCVNIEHLFLGEPRENSGDMTKKCRQAFGERQHSAKLTDDKVREILRLYRDGLLTNGEIGARFGVTKGAVRYIVIGKTWKHITA